MIRLTQLKVFAFAAWVSFASLPVWAHSLYVFGAGEGKAIRGKVYLRGGTGVPEAEVQATAPNGAVLASGKTDAQGQFFLPVPFRCDYTLRVALADGHQAEWKVSADELSTDLPPFSPATSSAEAGTDRISNDSPLGTLPHESPLAGSSQKASLSDRTVGGPGSFGSELRALQRQLVELRQEWQQFRHEVQLRDILGGIGYILGLSGVSFYLLARKR